MSKVNASSSFRGYILKTVYYNSSGTATKVGSILPDFPAMMFYGAGGGGMDMSLNGATFYLQPAATINLYATNGSNQMSFGYEIIDETLGFPIKSDSMNKLTSISAVVPAGRSYTISFYRMPYRGGDIGYFKDPICDGRFMNATTCPAPPKSNTTGVLANNQVISFNQSLIVMHANVYGCVNPAIGANNSAINITEVSVKMVPWISSQGIFISPSNGDDGSLNLSSQLQFNRTYPGCLVYYNLTLMANTGYMIEMYAKNASDATGDPGTAYNLAGFQNFTATDGGIVNITLYRLTGNYMTTSSAGVNVNNSLMKVNILNSSGGAVTTNVNANVKVKNRQAGFTAYYMINSDNINNGSFYVPLLNNSNSAKVMIFSNNGPPTETSIDLTKTETNITIISMGNNDKGFRKKNANGSLETVDLTETPIKLRFLMNTPECSLPNAPDSCELTSMTATSFNPLKAMLAGKVNMEIKITSTNVSLIFHDYDMMSAKQPPMFSIIDENASATGSTGQMWDFGSFAPADSYSNVTIVTPYSDTSTNKAYLNDANVNASIPVLFNENQAVVWNISNGGTQNNLPEDFIDYNKSFYQPLINSSLGVECKNNISELCFINTTGNYIALKIPHFSTITQSLLGQAYTAPVVPEEEDPSGGGGGGTTSTNRTNSTEEAVELEPTERKAPGSDSDESADANSESQDVNTSPMDGAKRAAKEFIGSVLFWTIIAILAFLIIAVAAFLGIKTGIVQKPSDIVTKPAMAVATPIMAVARPIGRAAKRVGSYPVKVIRGRKSNSK